MHVVRSLENRNLSEGRRDHAASCHGRYARTPIIRYGHCQPSLSYGETDCRLHLTGRRHVDANQAYLSRSLSGRIHPNWKDMIWCSRSIPIEAQFLVPIPPSCTNWPDSARAIMERTPEVCLASPPTGNLKYHVLTIRYDQPSARALGLSRNDVSLSLLTATGGIPYRLFLRRYPTKQHLPEMPRREGRTDRGPGQRTSLLLCLPERTDWDEETMVSWKLAHFRKKIWWKASWEAHRWNKSAKRLISGGKIRWFPVTTGREASGHNVRPHPALKRKKHVLPSRNR